MCINGTKKKKATLITLSCPWSKLLYTSHLAYSDGEKHLWGILEVDFMMTEVHMKLIQVRCWCELKFDLDFPNKYACMMNELHKQFSFSFSFFYRIQYMKNSQKKKKKKVWVDGRGLILLTDYWLRYPSY